MPRTALRPVWPALLLLLGLIGCAPANRPAPGLTLAPSLLACRDEPPVPDMTSDADLMGFLLDVIEAGEDCRTRLARVREIFEARNK
jgi:hypothetical protein